MYIVNSAVPCDNASYADEVSVPHMHVHNSLSYLFPFLFRIQPSMISLISGLSTFSKASGRTPCKKKKYDFLNYPDQAVLHWVINLLFKFIIIIIVCF